jgi:uncharacterized Zn-binding protein involved in type VI secretion
MKTNFVLFISALFVLSFLQSNAPADKPNSKVSLYLVQVAGVSPMVFTEGWVFGAKGILNKGFENETDISESIKWSGTGTFTPSTGATTNPVFEKEGLNEITMTYDYQGMTYSETFTVYAVSSVEYANSEDPAITTSDTHGCPACPHNSVGYVSTFSSTVKVRGLPAVRKGDKGTHLQCCGPNTFEVVGGDPNVLVDGKPSAKIGSKTQHCGGFGNIWKKDSKELDDLMEKLAKEKKEKEDKKKGLYMDPNDENSGK